MKVNMNKNNILKTLIIVLLILVIIPIIVYANSRIQEDISLTIPIELSEQEIYNQIREERRMEQQQFEEDFRNGKIKEDEFVCIDDLIIKAELAEKEERNTENQIINIINRYHEKELKELLKRAEKEKKEMREVDITFSYYTISDEEISFYKLVLDVLENKRLSAEDSEILKNMLINGYYNIVDDAILKVRFEKALEI